MIRWKVCGITSVRDAQAAVAAGADAIGLVFYRRSPRHLEPEQAARIAAALPRSTWRIGVFVDAPAEEMARITETAGLDFLQLSGDEPPEMCGALPRHAFKAVRLRPDATGDEALAMAERYPDCTLLLDAAHEGMYGGTGRRTSWPAAAAVARRHRLFLAGGLTPENLEEAVQTVRPWAVDVSSGVEIEPGVKDHAKLRAFGRALGAYR